MRLMNLSAVAIFATLAVNPLYSQTYAPTVTMAVTTPDGQTQEVSARESSTATVKLKDGSEYLVRPTVLDEPFSKVTVAFFKSDSTPIGEVQVVKGKPAVDSKTTPAFKIAVKSIELQKK
jgi:hypothetical protein